MFIFFSIIAVIVATFLEHYNTKRNGLNGWNSTERSRPKSFYSSFSILYNYSQIFNSPQRHYLTISEPSNTPSDSFRGSSVDNFPRSSFNSPMIVSDYTTVLDFIKTFALFWVCFANFYWLGFQPQVLPSVCKFFNNFQLFLS